MKDVDLKNLKTTGVYTHSNITLKKKSTVSKSRKSFSFDSLVRKKEMRMTGDKFPGERDKNQSMKEYLSLNFKISGIHIYTVETYPFRARLVMGEPLDNEALIMSYYAHNNTEVITSALGIHSPEVKSRMITQMYIEAVDFRSYIGKDFLIIFDSMILEAFKGEKDVYNLLEYTHKCLTGKLKTGRS